LEDEQDSREVNRDYNEVEIKQWDTLWPSESFGDWTTALWKSDSCPISWVKSTVPLLPFLVKKSTKGEEMLVRPFFVTLMFEKSG
jgi:hypothetical protein